MNQPEPWIRHFGFTGTPFSKGIPAHQLFNRSAHQQAVARLQFCIQEAALAVLVGDVGAGKPVTPGS